MTVVFNTSTRLWNIARVGADPTLTITLQNPGPEAVNTTFAYIVLEPTTLGTSPLTIAQLNAQIYPAGNVYQAPVGPSGTSAANTPFGPVSVPGNGSAVFTVLVGFNAFGGPPHGAPNSIVPSGVYRVYLGFAGLQVSPVFAVPELINIYSPFLTLVSAQFSN